MNAQEKPNFPVSSSYIPFLPSPEFLRTHPTLVEEYVPQPVKTGEMIAYNYVPTPINKPSEVKPLMKKQMTKYGYVPVPINRPSKAEELMRKQKQELPPKGSAATRNRRNRRLRQLQKPIEERKSYIQPTSSIAVGDPYWFPVFWNSRKPKEHALFSKTFAKLADKQRVMIKTYGDGKITVWRAGEEITLRKANSFGIGTQF